MEQICLNSPESIISLVGMAVMAASTLANFVPAPAKIENPVMRFFSRALHFVAADIVTAAKR